MKRISTLSALVLSLFAWGCDNAGDMTQPGMGPRGMVVMSTTGERYVVAVEADPAAGSVSATIGDAGGELVLGAHKLLVSPGAVSAPTSFTMSRSAEEPLRVKLTAGQASENDIGAAGFAAPVTLVVSYADAYHLPSDLSTVTGIYFRPDGLVEVLGGVTNPTAETTSFNLPHFSLFGIAWP